jgi:hypothetical protein
MTTTIRLPGLVGWSVRCVSVALALAFCASAFADPSKNVVSLANQPAKKTTHKVCYTFISGSAIPQPCDRLGVIPTTAVPMTIIGVAPVIERK